MAKSIKLMVTDPYYASADEVVEPGTLLELDADVPAGMRVKEVIHDDEAPEPQFHPVTFDPAVSAGEQPAPPAQHAPPAAAEGAEDDEDKPARSSRPEHRSAGGKAGGRA
jgi:hypothetical protein